MSFSQKAKSKWRSLLGQEEPQDDSLLGSLSEEKNELCKQLDMTRKQRFQAFVICLAVGIGLGMLSTVMLFFHNTTGFAITYTLGVLTSLLSSLFLWGPRHQLKNMFKETRLFATLAMLLFMALTLTAALYWKKAGLALIFCGCQFLAYTWYCLSYIPFGRKIATKCMTSCISVE